MNDHKEIVREFGLISDSLIEDVRILYDGITSSSFAIGDMVNDYYEETKKDWAGQEEEYKLHINIQLAYGLKAEAKTIKDWVRVCSVWTPELRESYSGWGISHFRACIKDGIPLEELANQAYDEDWTVQMIKDTKSPKTWGDSINSLIYTIERLQAPMGIKRKLLDIIPLLRRILDEGLE
jgi:hypothetical protein